jgi:putative oxidoreductase
MIAYCMPHRNHWRTVMSIHQHLYVSGNRYAANLLRISLAVMYLTHSVVLKLSTFGLAGTVGYFSSLGFPPAFTYLVIGAEIAGGLLLLANIATQWVSLALIPILLGAVWVHAPNGWVFSAQGGGWEYPVFLVAISLAVALQAFANRRSTKQVTLRGEPIAAH